MHKILKVLIIISISLIIFSMSLLGQITEGSVEDNSNSEIDNWIAWDKIAHFTTSYFLSNSSYYLLREQLNSSKELSISIGLGFSFSMGIFKEILDMKKPRGYFSKKDMIYNVFGSIIGIWTIHSAID